MSDRLDALNEFQEAYASLKEGERDNFSRLVSKLLDETFLVRGKKKDKEDYYFVSENKDLFTSYFEVIDFELRLDPLDGIAYLSTTMDRGRVHLNKFDTVLLLLLRKTYHAKMKEATSDSKALLSLADLIDLVRATKVFDPEKKLADYEESLRKLKRHKVVDFDSGKIDEAMNIEILPTIVVLIPLAEIEAINAKLSAYGASNEAAPEGESDENAD